MQQNNNSLEHTYLLILGKVIVFNFFIFLK